MMYSIQRINVIFLGTQYIMKISFQVLWKLILYTKHHLRIYRWRHNTHGLWLLLSTCGYELMIEGHLIIEKKFEREITRSMLWTWCSCNVVSQLPSFILVATCHHLNCYDSIGFPLQVMGHEKRSTVKQVVKDLINEDGWKGFYRGLGPRFVSMSAWGTSMILAYEYLSKKFSLLTIYYINYVHCWNCFC